MLTCVYCIKDFFIVGDIQQGISLYGYNDVNKVVKAFA